MVSGVYMDTHTETRGENPDVSGWLADGNVWMFGKTVKPEKKISSWQKPKQTVCIKPI